MAWFDGRGTVEGWTRFFALFLVVLYNFTEKKSHEGNTEVENGGYVVIKWNIHISAGKQGGEGGGALLRPLPHIYTAGLWMDR